ncbi:BTB/POZ domain-containing protein Tiwaz-like isoform X2 [Macrosteles quadrilineatus]|nr:BTB/POZ domain-containing protein Tiwaz-like isoform X2 [Macrosteles quadrilineatus]
MVTYCSGLPPEMKTITLNVGGVLFTTSPSTLTRYPDSRLAQNYKPGRETYFYDRDGEMFRLVLNYVRSGKLLLPSSFDQLDQLLEEAHYYNLYSMYDDIVQLQESRQKEQESVETNRDPPKHPNEETPADQRAKADTENDTDSAYECVIVCADEDGKVERWFSAPVDLRFESNGCLLGVCETMTGYSHILDYRDYMARPGNTVPDHFNIAAIVARLLRAGFSLVSSSSGMDEWHREFYFVFVRSSKKN